MLISVNQQIVGKVVHENFDMYMIVPVSYVDTVTQWFPTVRCVRGMTLSHIYAVQ